ncbi:MAG TPA: chromate efflux transporter [Verrucomicrobiae bacterium]|nr:chromate efflux transporter [Verrucomicrobiae bacterium]
MPPARSSNQTLRELAGLFLKLGTIAFGGPAAHVAMMEDEVVRRRKWLTHAEFLDLLGATNLIPGPNSTEMAIHIGHRRAGWAGLIIGGVCFILPAMLIVTAIAWAYVRYGKLPEANALLYGVKPVIIAVVVQALWSLGRTAVKTKTLAVVGMVALVACFLGVNELIILFLTGFAMIPLKAVDSKKQNAAFLPLLVGAPSAAAAVVASGAATVPFSLNLMFFFFLKVGAVLFGSGYVLLAFLRADLVERWGWLTENQLLDAIAVGQFTPGPVFTTATFIGFILSGPMGALLATVGIFLPAFVFVAVSAPLIPKLRTAPAAGAFLDGVNVASLALMAVVTWQLSASALVDWITVLLAILATAALLLWRLNSVWLVLAGGAVGFIKYLFG